MTTLQGKEVTIVDVIDDSGIVGIRDGDGGYAEVNRNDLDADSPGEVERLEMVNICLSNLLARLKTTDGAPGTELERCRKAILG